MQSAFLNTDFTKTNSTDNNTAPEATTPANTTEQAIEASEFTGTELEGTNIDKDIKDLPEDSTHTVTKNDNGTYTVDIDFGNGKTGKMEYSDKGSINSGRIDYPDGSRDEITADAEGKITTKYDTNNNIKETVLENEDGSSTKIIEADENGNKAVENYDSNGEIKSKIIYGDDGEAEKVIEYNSDGTRDVYFEDEGQTHVLHYNTDGTRTDTFEIDGTTYVIKSDSNGDEEYSAIMREDETTRIYQCLDDVYYIFQYDENGNLDSISNEYGEFMEYNDDGEIERTSVSSEEKINTKYIDKRIKEAIKDKENSTQTKQDYETSTNNAQKAKSKAEFAKLRARDVQ